VGGGICAYSAGNGYIQYRTAFTRQAGTGQAEKDNTATGFACKTPYENSLVVDPGQSGCVQRYCNNAEVAMAEAERLDNKRIISVWPRTVEIEEEECEGWHLCAALAGLRSVAVPYQELSGIELQGLTDVHEDIEQVQLDLLADTGVTPVIWQDGVIMAYDVVTTAQSEDLLVTDECIQTNLDSIEKLIRLRLQPFMRRGAIQHSISQLRLQLRTIMMWMERDKIPRLGGQLISAKVSELRRHVLFRRAVSGFTGYASASSE
jgi:hypothetical protein